MGGVDAKEIPSFWAAALSNHGTVGQLVTEEDMEALESLTDITCVYNEEWSGFTLTFKFKENKFFSNKVCIGYILILKLNTTDAFWWEYHLRRSSRRRTSSPPTYWRRRLLS